MPVGAESAAGEETRSSLEREIKPFLQGRLVDLGEGIPGSQSNLSYSFQRTSPLIL